MYNRAKSDERTEKDKAKKKIEIKKREERSRLMMVIWFLSGLLEVGSLERSGDGRKGNRCSSVLGRGSRSDSGSVGAVDTRDERRC